MRGLGYLNMACFAAALVTSASGAQAQSTDITAREQPSNAATIICAATHEYRGKEISVRRNFKPNGTEIAGQDADRQPIRAGDDEVAAKIRKQLFDYVSNMVSTRDKDCSPLDEMQGNEIHVFDCSTFWKEGANHYSVDYNNVSWRYEEGSDWRLQMNWNIRGYDFLANGFPDRDHKTAYPYLGGDRPKQWPAANSYVQKKDSKRLWTRSEIGEVRVGEYADRQWTTSNTVFNLAWNKWPELMKGEGDIQFKVYDTQKGVLLEKTFPRTFLPDIEAKLQSGYRDMIEKARDNVTSCKRLDSWEGGEDEMIVVT